MNIKFGDSSLNLKVDGSLANIDRGPRGYSAYEIAVQEGFVGTEEEWLASLVGPEGKQGKDGERGIQGPRGQQGDRGDTGPQGDKGEKGDTGPSNVLSIGSVTKGDEANATITGESPNQILNLVLPKGDKGEKGDTGSQGETGATGNGILSIQKTATAGLVDTYTTTFTNGTTTTFDVTNGEDGEVTQAQLDESQAKQDTKIDWLQTLVNQMPTVSDQGTDLSLESVLNYRLMKFLPQGVSSQDGEPTPTTPITVKNVTGENGLVLQNENLCNGTSKHYFASSTGVITNAGTNAYLSIPEKIKVKPNTQYTIKFYGYESYTSGVYLAEYDSTDTFIQRTTSNLTFTTGANTYYIFVYIYNNSNPFTQIDTNIALVKGSTAPSTYVEHEEQNYQISLGNIELNSSPDGTIRDGIIGSSGVSYNLFDITQYPVISKIAYSSRGEQRNWANYVGVNNYFLVKPSTTYNISNSLSETTSMIVYYDKQQNILSTQSNSNTFTTPSNAKYIRFCYYDTSERIPSWIQITEGSTAKPYFPYGQVGMWYKREYIGKVVLDGSENWTKANSTSSSDYLVCYFTSTSPKGDNYQSSLSNYFIYGVAGSSSSSNCFQPYTSGNNLGFNIKISTSIADTVNNFKIWLSTHNTIVWYPLAQYTDIPITDTTLINQLNDIYNNAHSYNGITNITTTYEDGNEQMYLDIEALAKGGSTTTETDPIFSASASSGITSSDITNWNGKASTTYVDTAIATAITNTLGGSF